MKTKVKFLSLFALFSLICVNESIGQTLFVNSKNFTGQSISVAPNTQVTLMVTLPSGATQTYWTAVAGMSATTPAQAFPITNPAANTVVLNTPVANGEYTVTVYFNDGPGGTLGTDVFVKLVVSTPVITGLLSSQQNVVGCQDVDLNYSATGGPQSNYTYVWQEWNGSTWVALSANAYYVALGHNLSLKLNSSLVGKRFRCAVSINDFIGSTTNTAEIIVTTVHPLPSATFTNVNVCAGDNATLVVSPTAGTAPWTVSMTNGTADLVSPSNTSPVVTSTTAVFTVLPSTTTTYHFQVTDNVGCSKAFG